MEGKGKPMNSVIKGASYVLVHTPDMVLYNGTTQTTERIVNPESEYLKEPVTSQIAGIEIMDLEDGVKVLWKLGIYAESGMGCTGPIILVSDANYEKAAEELKKAGYIN